MNGHGEGEYSTENAISIINTLARWREQLGSFYDLHRCLTNYCILETNCST